MNKACLFFKISDITRHYPRNYKKYPDITVEKNYVYKEGYGKYTAADLFYKPGLPSYPVLVNVHGGGFVKGDKVHRKALCCEFAREGYFVYNVNYRLAPQYAFPAGVEDVVDALDKLPELAEKFPLDLSTVVLTGDSAGAFYSAAGVLSSTSEAYRRAANVRTPKVVPTAYMGFCGAYRLEDLLFMKTPLNVSYDIADALFHGKFHGNTDTIKSQPHFAATNLVSYVDERFPKTFLLYSKSNTFCGGQGELLSEKLRNSGVQTEEFIARGKKDGHCFHLFPFHKTTPAVMERAKAFLRSLRSV